MDAIEFLRDFRRMCLSYGDTCTGCELDDAQCSLMAKDCDHEKVIRVVEKWAKAHPLKTRLSEFKKLLFNASEQAGGCPSLCTKFFDPTVMCKDSEGCLECKKKFWLTPIKEETNDSMDKIPEEW